MNAESKLLEIRCYWDEGGKEHGLALRDQLWLLEHSLASEAAAPPCRCDLEVGYLCAIHAKEKLIHDVSDWLVERHENCLRLAAQKPEADRKGWLEDARYFECAIKLLASPSGQPAPRDEELEVLKNLPDDKIDTSDIPEVKDWSKAVRGKFYRGDALNASEAALRDCESFLVGLTTLSWAGGYNAELHRMLKVVRTALAYPSGQPALAGKKETGK